MTGRRFELISKFLHLNDSEGMPPSSSNNYDKLYKIRPFLDRVITNFKRNYTPHQQLPIDESMIGFKGRLSWVQYMPKKPTKWGLKAWVLADSTNGYVYNWKLYTGKEGGNNDKGLGHRVVTDLVDDLRDKGYHLFVDNFYTSPTLFTDLIDKGFTACGTLNLNCRGIPKSFIRSKLRKGETYSELSEDGRLLYLKWKDKRDVTVLSSFQDDSSIMKRRRSRHATGGTETVKKPKMVDEYNQFMGGVDRSDQQVLYYGFAHRSVKWWKRVFYHLVDLCLVNALILHNSVTGNKQLTQLEFNIQVAKSLLEGHENRTPRQRSIELPLRLTERPFLEPVPKDTPYGGRPSCEVCLVRKKGRKQTQYQCKTCKTPLHVTPCFEIYHTKLNYHEP